MISILCPCYNEEEVLPLFFNRLIPIIEDIVQHNDNTFEVICVNDGSSDGTLDILKEYAKKYNQFKIIDLSRHFGKEAALTAALDYSQGDAVIPIDVDLQHPPELIPTMIHEWKKGYEVVLARRSNREADIGIRKLTARMFYQFHNKISRFHIPEDIGDFRLMDKKVVDAIGGLRENCRFMKGLFAWAGFKSCTIDYVCENRAEGKSKFNIYDLWNLAVEGITSFSTAPLTMWTYIGGSIAFIAFVYGFYIFIKTLILGIDVPGYASLLCLILLFGGLQLLSIGILGEYLGRTYIESKKRPIYLIRNIFESKN